MPVLPISPVLAWFIAGIIFFAVELLLPGLILFFFGIGAWCAALAVYLLPIELSSQLLIFLAASILTLLLLRSTLKKVFLGKMLDVDAVDTDIPANATGLVIEAINPPAEGKIKYGGSFWRASADRAIPVGTTVRILEKKNLTVKVCTAESKGEA